MNASSEKLADEHERRFPEDTAVKFNYLPVVRARLALNQHQPARAVELLAVSYELGTPPSGAENHFGTMYPVYVRGEALLAAERGAETQLGRAFLAAGDARQAASAYRAFLDLWKEADQDLPLLAAAKAELARLQ